MQYFFKQSPLFTITKTIYSEGIIIIVHYNSSTHPKQIALALDILLFESRGRMHNRGSRNLSLA